MRDMDAQQLLQSHSVLSWYSGNDFQFFYSTGNKFWYAFPFRVQKYGPGLQQRLK